MCCTSSFQECSCTTLWYSGSQANLQLTSGVSSAMSTCTRMTNCMAHQHETLSVARKMVDTVQCSSVITYYYCTYHHISLRAFRSRPPSTGAPCSNTCGSHSYPARRGASLARDECCDLLLSVLWMGEVPCQYLGRTSNRSSALRPLRNQHAVRFCNAVLSQC
jgi:hypothetical protein